MNRLALALLSLLGLVALVLPVVGAWLIWPPLSVGVLVLMVWTFAALRLPRGKP